MALDLTKIRKMGAAFLRHARLSEAYRAVFDGPEGKRVLTDILEQGGILATSMTSGDPHTTSFNEGKRALALHVLDQLRFSPMQILALAEAKTDNEALRLGEQDAA